MTDTIQKIADEMTDRASKLRREAGDGDHLLQVIGREVAETVNGWAGRLRALSARASAGEGVRVWKLVGTEMRPIEQEYEVGVMPKVPKPTEWETLYLWEAKVAAITKNGKPPVTAAPQPAQAGASGGGEWRPITSSKQYAEALAAGLRVEFTIIARDTYDMPPSDQDDSGGWVRQDHDDPWIDEGKHRAYYPVATPTHPAHGDGEGDYAAKWFAECRRVLEDVSTEMRATGRGDTRFRRLIESMPRQRTTRPTTEYVEGVCAAANALVRRLDEVHADLRYMAVWVTAQLHNGPYVGPKYDSELTALRAALTTRPTPEAQEARDAARYRFIRTRLQPISGLQFGVGQDRAELVDAAIDAALALPAQGEGNNG